MLSLTKGRKAAGHKEWPVAQLERDLVFLSIARGLLLADQGFEALDRFRNGIQFLSIEYKGRRSIDAGLLRGGGFLQEALADGFRVRVTPKP